MLSTFSVVNLSDNHNNIINNSNNNDAESQKQQRRPSPLELPETMTLIQFYLEGDAQATLACCLVSKSFHQAFAPLLWTHLKLPCGKQQVCPQVDQTRKNAHLVRSLTFSQKTKTPFPEELVTMRFPRLKRLAYENEYEWNSPGSYGLGLTCQLANQHKDILEELELGDWRISEHHAPPEIWQELSPSRGSGFQNLQSLCLRDFEIDVKDDDTVEVLWEICAVKTLKELRIESGWIVDSSLDEDDEDQQQDDDVEQRLEQQCKITGVKPSMLEHIVFDSLTLDRKRFDRLWRILDPKTCPGLRSLVWKKVSTELEEDNLHSFGPWARKILTENTTVSPIWKDLTKLELWSCNLSDDFLARLLKYLPGPLSELNLEKSFFGSRSFEVLMDQYTGTLSRLNLVQCRGVESWMWHGILCSFSCLTSIAGDMLEASVIVALGSSTEEEESELDEIRGRPWICKDLQEWKLAIDMDLGDNTDAHSQVFARLSTLTKLSTLALPFRVWHLRPEPLWFRLDRGLGQLQSLRNLKELVFHQQSSSEQDWAWILETFGSSLKRVTRSITVPMDSVRERFLEGLKDQYHQITFKTAADLLPYRG
ncbi:hypothetical protein BGZ83_008087 [Gryganskiella cystojenkinii]|nr:hypothetical protein BGZ83_008087 [Gryganskiella cystojenkinii]